MNSGRKKIVIVVLAAAFILAAALAFLAPRGNPPAPVPEPTPVATTVPQSPYQPVAQHAPKGELISGFPKELILDDLARLENSFSVNFNPGLNQYAATFNSQISMLQLFDLYKSYFTKNGWTITNEITKYPDSRGLYAKKGKTETSVAIISQAKNSQVVVSYVAK